MRGLVDFLVDLRLFAVDLAIEIDATTLDHNLTSAITFLADGLYQRKQPAPFGLTLADMGIPTESLTSEGVDVLFDGIGGSHIWCSRKSLRSGGKVVVYGFTSKLRGGQLSSGRPGGRHRFREAAILGVQVVRSWLPGVASGWCPTAFRHSNG